MLGLHYKQWASVKAANTAEAIEKVYQAVEEGFNAGVAFGSSVFFEYTEPSTWEAEEIEGP